jgi:hypothetical protein
MANSKISALTSASTVAGTEVLPIVQSSATVKVSVANLTPGLDTITAAKGGTGQTSYAVGDLLYANTTTTLAKLADVATGNALISGGVGVAPSWGKIGLTTHVSGTLPVANGGTNASSASITAFNNITGYSASGATGTTTTNLVFSTSPTITTPSITGDATLSTGNVVQGTAAKGFNFTANTAQAGMTSQLLGWYEEGTWTPTFTNLTLGNGTAQARYTRTGREVTVQVYVLWGSTTSASGAWYVTNLPFTPAATHKSYGVGNILDSGIENYTCLAIINESSTNLFFAAMGAATVYTTYTNVTATVPIVWGASDAVRVSVTYMV